MKKLLFALMGFAAFLPGAGMALEVEMVEVGNPGNAADPASGKGAVSYVYRIGKYEITNREYVAFLNVVAVTDDPYGLFDPLMASHSLGGITRQGEEGSFRYQEKEGREDEPVCFVTWYNAARFVNWLHTGQGAGGTEHGAYDLNGAMTGSFTHTEAANVWLPTPDEWYKAAYYDPTRGESGGYWLYATRSDEPPKPRSPDSVEPNAANVNGWRSPVGATPVGAYRASMSHYGTHDQAGNVLEYVEEFFVGGELLVQGYGGNYSFGAEYTKAHGSYANPHGLRPGDHNDSAGFRIATKPDFAWPTP